MGLETTDIMLLQYEDQRGIVPMKHFPKTLIYYIPSVQGLQTHGDYKGL